MVAAAIEPPKFTMGYIAHNGTDEPPDTTRIFIVDATLEDGSPFRFTLGELYSGLQMRDLSTALSYANENFSSSMKMGRPEGLEVFIRKLHQKAALHLVMYSTETLKSGYYRDDVCFIERAKHQPSVIPSEISNEMKIFCEALYEKLSGLNAESTPEAVKEVALFALTELGRIHPFANGNGRIARILMNCILMKEGYAPVLFKEKNAYHSAFDQYMGRDISHLAKMLDMTKYSPSHDTRPVVELKIAQLDSRCCIIFNNPGEISFGDKIAKRQITMKAEDFLALSAKRGMDLFAKNLLNGIVNHGFLKKPPVVQSALHFGAPVTTPTTVDSSAATSSEPRHD